MRPRASSDQVRPKAFCSFLETAGIKAPFSTNKRGVGHSKDGNITGAESDSLTEQPQI